MLKRLLLACALALAAFVGGPIDALAQVYNGPVTFSLTSAGATAPFTPTNLDFNLNIQAGTGSAVCYIERRADGVNWTPLTVAGQPFPVLTYTGAPISESVHEAQPKVAYRLDCGLLSGTSFTSGTVPGSFTQ